MYKCFACFSLYSTIDILIMHIKFYHNLETQSIYNCKQQECSNILDNLIMEINVIGSIFGKIMSILINNSKLVYFICELYFTVGFNSHFNVYEIMKYKEK